MRRIFVWLILCAAFGPLSLHAEDRAAEAAARAQREEAEERYRRLNGKVETLTETLDLLLKNQERIHQRINALGSEIDEVKRSQIRSGVNYATQEQVKELVEKLQEIDRKRIADNENVLKVLRDLQKVPLAAVPAVSEKASPATLPEPGSWDYVIQTNDTLKKIVIGYNKELQKQGYAPLTMAQVLKANPSLNQDKLLVGKKILIPIPPRKEDKSARNRAY